MASHLPLTTDASKNTATRETNFTSPSATAHVALVEVTKTNGVDGSRVVGSLNHHFMSAATTNAANIKATAGRLYSIRVWNSAVYPVFLKFHNTTGTPTAGAGVVLTIGCEPGRKTSETYAGGLDIFNSGIGRTVVKGHIDSDATVIAANDVVVDVEYA